MNPFYWSILTALIWGFVPMIEKLGLAKVDPYVGLFYRCLGVVIGIGVLLLWRADVRAAVLSPPSGIWYLIAGGLIASVLGQICFYTALKTGDISKVVPLAASYPLISFILGLLFLGEQVTLAKVGGLALILGGIVLLK